MKDERKRIGSIKLPAKYTDRFNASKAAEESKMLGKLTDAQHVARLVCWALEQLEEGK